MNYLHQYAEFTTIEEGRKSLNEAIKLRNQMGGALYFGILSADIFEIRMKLEKLEREEKEKNTPL